MYKKYNVQEEANLQAFLEIISEFGVQTFGTGYQYHFVAEQIEKIEISKQLIVPTIPLEAQFILYTMMNGWQPQRRFKKKLITNFLKVTGLNHPEVFDDALYNHSLPYWTKSEIRALIANE